MCGICGFNWDDKDLVVKMADAIVYRGPDDSGYYNDKGISFGHRRLSIIDISAAGHQPMCNEDGSIWIVFNGEIYNYIEIKPGLMNKHSFNSKTDTEVLIHGYEEWGIEGLLPRLNGMFAFAIWDSRKQVLILARDRIGKKPLYYHINGDRILFASELKSMLQYQDIKKKADLFSLNSLLSYRFIVSSRTIVKGIKKLLPGHYLVFQEKKAIIHKYWDLHWVDSQPKGELYYTKRFSELFKAAVERRLVADVPLGAYLSGGLDSSAVVAMNANLRKDPVKTFTVGFNDGTDEFKHARVVADHFNCDHHEIVINYDDMTREFKKIIWFMDEPSTDMTNFPMYFLSRESKKHVTVINTGEGADELFAGYPYYQIGSSWIKHVPNKIKGMVMSWYYSPFKRKDIDSLLGKHSNYYPLLRYYLQAPVPAAFLNRLLFFDIKNELPNWQLHRVDRMTMAFGQEARAPFLDQKLLEFSTTVPTALKLNGLNGKYLVKQAMKGILPECIISRKKQGFTTPYFKWLKGDLLYLLEESISDSSNEGFPLNPDYIKKLIDKFKATKRHQLFSYTSYQLVIMLILKQWEAQYLLN